MKDVRFFILFLTHFQESHPSIQTLYCCILQPTHSVKHLIIEEVTWDMSELSDLLLKCPSLSKLSSMELGSGCILNPNGVPRAHTVITLTIRCQMSIAALTYLSYGLSPTEIHLTDDYTVIEDESDTHRFVSVNTLCYHGYMA